MIYDDVTESWNDAEQGQLYAGDTLNPASQRERENISLTLLTIFLMVQHFVYYFECKKVNDVSSTEPLQLWL